MGKSVVIVNTSAGSMGGGPTGVWLSELADPYYAFQAAGLEVTVASIAGGAIPIDANSMGEPYFGDQAKKFMHDQKAVGALTHSVKVEASMADAFDCVYLAGGHGCCVDFVGPQAGALKDLIAAAYAAGKVVAADCHRPCINQMVAPRPRHPTHWLIYAQATAPWACSSARSGARRS